MFLCFVNILIGNNKFIIIIIILVIGSNASAITTISTLNARDHQV